MKTNQSTPLSNEGSFEKIVNAGTKRRRNQTERWFSKLLTVIVVLLLAELVNLILWLLNVVPDGASVALSITISCMVSFLAGRLYGVAVR